MLIPFDQLFSRFRIRTAGVLHLGANTGQEAAMYASLGIRKVIWVEALEDVFENLKQHIMPYPGQIAVRGCLGESDGEVVTFHRANNESQSSSYLDFGTHAQEHPTTKFVEDIAMTTVRVDSLLAQQSLSVGPGWFLNVDLQGAELKTLLGMGNLIHQFDHVYIEVNIRELYKGCPLVREIDEYLAKLGFVGKETKMMKQGWGDKYYQRKSYVM